MNPRGLFSRPRIFYGWYIVGASVGMNFYLSIVFFQGLQIFFLPITEEFGWSRTMTSSAFALRQLESGLLAPVIGFSVDRWGPRKVILWGVLSAGLGMVMMSAISGIWTFYFTVLVVSLGSSGASHGVSWAVVVTKWFHRLRGRALGFAFMGPVLGGPFVVTMVYMEEAMGWRMTLLILGVLLWLVGIPLAMIARSRPQLYGYLPDGDVTPGKEIEEVADETLYGLNASEAVRTRAFWFLSLLFAGQFIGLSGLMVHMIPLLEDFGYSSATAATILGLVFLFSGIGRLGSGFLADAVDHRIVLAALLAIQVLAILFLTVIGAGSYWQLIVFALFFGIGFGGTIPLRPILVIRIFGDRALGAIQGLMHGGAISAGMVGPILYGWIFDATSEYTAALYISAAIALVVIPLAFLMDSRRQGGTVTTVNS
jgi:MFS family permease